MVFERPRGTRDFNPDDMSRRDYVEDALSSVFQSFNYCRVMSPVFEYTELFSMKSGDEIKEHMYVFDDKGGRSLCLRPEETAAVCRMFVQDLRSRQLPLKLYYHGPMYRYEEPQKGRYREFWQSGVELIGSSTPESDAEAVALAASCLEKLGLEYTIRVSNIRFIRGFLEAEGLSENEQDKVIQLLDKGSIQEVKKIVRNDKFFKLIEKKCGPEGVDEAISEVKELLKTRTEGVDEFKETLKLLESAGVDYTLDLSMARGLDYYTGMVFDVKVEGLGAQNQVCGGGRYDNLIELFGGPKTPAVGFAFGFDRLIEAMEMQGIKFPEEHVDVYVAAVGDARFEAQKIASELRNTLKGRKVELDLMRRKLGKALEHASNLKARYAVIIGPEDAKQNAATVRDMESGEQERVSLKDLAKKLK